MLVCTTLVLMKPVDRHLTTYEKAVHNRIQRAFDEYCGTRLSAPLAESFYSSFQGKQKADPKATISWKLNCGLELGYTRSRSQLISKHISRAISSGLKAKGAFTHDAHLTRIRKKMIKKIWNAQTQRFFEGIESYIHTSTRVQAPDIVVPGAMFATGLFGGIAAGVLLGTH